MAFLTLSQHSYVLGKVWDEVLQRFAGSASDSKEDKVVPTPTIRDGDTDLLDREISTIFGDTFEKATNLAKYLLGASSLPGSIDFAQVLAGNSGYKFLRTIFCHIDVNVLPLLKKIDIWILAVFARKEPEIVQHLRSQLNGKEMQYLDHYLDPVKHTREINASEPNQSRRLLLSLCIGGTGPMLKELLDAGVDLGGNEQYYFDWAAWRGNFDAAVLLLEQGARIDIDSVTEVFRDVSEYLEDSKTCDSLCVFTRKVLEAVGPLNKLPEDTLILGFFVRAFTEAVAFAEPDRTWKRFKDFSESCMRFITLLLEFDFLRERRLPWKIGWVVIGKYGGWARGGLFLAVDFQNTELVRLLLEGGYDTEETCADNETTPLHHAVYLGLVDQVRLLLETGADIMKRGRDGREIWKLAAKHVNDYYDGTTGGKLYRTDGPEIKRPHCHWPLGEYTEQEEDEEIFSMIRLTLRHKHNIDYDHLYTSDLDEIQSESFRSHAH